MKKLFLYLLTFVTAFNLAGGYTFAAALNQPDYFSKTANHEHTTVTGKHINYLQNRPQLFKEEKQDEDLIKCDLTFTPVLLSVFQFVPEFSVRSKHFLVHYATAIKAELPSLYLLGQVFRL
jgi:hypothetical protein